MLWLALRFPELALDCLPGVRHSPLPWILVAHGRVVVCNASARALGVQAGQGLNAAFALAPEALQGSYDPALQARALQDLAGWAFGFAAEVSLEPPDTLLLEVGSTLRYFGGLTTLRQRLREALHAREQQDALEAYAPTPLAALWLVRATPGYVLDQPEQLAEVLGRLSLRVTGLSEQICAALSGVGVESIAQALALSPAALARRFGPGLPDLFDRALGRSPDPRLCLKPEQHFQRQIELPTPILEVSRLMTLVERLLPDLVDWAWRMARILTRIALTLQHDQPPETRLEIGFAGTRNPEHLRMVIDERLHTLQLRAGVECLCLEILAAEPASSDSDDLLPAPPGRLREGQELLERLRARLGHEAVRGLAERPDHRPERAWDFVEPGSRTTAGRLAGSDTGPAGLPLVPFRPGPRPLWLLEHPRDLGGEGLPRLGGPLRLLAGPERIEGGWWDGSDVVRDYFVAAGPDGPQYWVYRERRGEARWFLQGVFA